MKITDGCIVLVLDSEEVNGLKYEKESLRQQLREIKQANKNIKTALKIMVGWVNKQSERSDYLSGCFRDIVMLINFSNMQL
ncbi:hypothetical protein [Enterobacter sp. RHB15-C17]